MANRSNHDQLEALAERLRDPFRLRMVIAGLAALIAYFAIFCPLEGKIRQSKRELGRETQRTKLAQEVELLRAQYEAFECRIQVGTDVNETVQYVLKGVRGFPLKLINLDVKEERKLTPYRAVEMRLHVSGDMPNLDALLAWLEMNDRLFRIESITLEPSRGESERRSMELTVLALKA